MRIVRTFSLISHWEEQRWAFITLSTLKSANQKKSAGARRKKEYEKEREKSESAESERRKRVNLAFLPFAASQRKPGSRAESHSVAGKARVLSKGVC